MILSATGHRPPRLGGYDNWMYDNLLKFATRQLEFFKPKLIYVGMALGWDTAVAKAAYTLDIPYIACIPNTQQSSKWVSEDQEIYHFLLRHAKEFYIASAEYSTISYFVRDRYMVDNSDSVLALFDGTEKGGTWQTVKYALEKEKIVFNVWDDWRHNETNP